jgi:ABC-type nitrate/sulfonate/bicarbonate transport system substrate-binding protein
MARKIPLVLLSIIVLQSSLGLAQERVKLRVSSATKTLGYGPLWIASRMGFFDRQGLDIEIVAIRASDVGIQALAGGSLEIAGSASDAPIAAVEKGLDLVIVGGIINGLTQSIMATKRFKTYADLRGATFGAISLTSGVTFALRHVLKVKGLEYPRDYKLLVIGGTPQTYAALIAGQIDAAALSLPVNYAAEEQGFNEIGRFVDVIPNYQLVPISGALDKTFLGRKESLCAGASDESDGADDALDPSKSRAGGGLSRQGNESQARARAARLGVLYRHAHVAS